MESGRALGLLCVKLEDALPVIFGAGIQATGVTLGYALASAGDTLERGSSVKEFLSEQEATALAEPVADVLHLDNIRLTSPALLPSWVPPAQPPRAVDGGSGPVREKRR